MGYSYRFGGKYTVGGTLSVGNALDNKDFITSGFEQKPLRLYYQRCKQISSQILVWLWTQLLSQPLFKILKKQIQYMKFRIILLLILDLCLVSNPV